MMSAQLYIVNEAPVRQHVTLDRKPVRWKVINKPVAVFSHTPFMTLITVPSNGTCARLCLHLLKGPYSL